MHARASIAAPAATASHRPRLASRPRTPRCSTAWFGCGLGLRSRLRSRSRSRFGLGLGLGFSFGLGLG